jgi:DNA-binding NarL/FixJ family response regulator
MIQILIVDDHAILRRGLKEILEREFRDVSIGGAGTAEQALTQLDSENWDLVILDITMPGRSGVDVLRHLKALRPKLPVLVLSMHPEDQYGKRVLKAGASGYIDKGCSQTPRRWSVRESDTGRDARRGLGPGRRHASARAII